MKYARLMTPTIALLATLFISSVPAFAQETEQEKKAVQAKIVEEKLQAAQAAELQAQLQAKAYSVVESKLAFETKLVKGAPYSAVAISESIQTLGDGNRIRQSSSTTVYRDSAGRTRREVMKKDGTVQSIVISDPSTGINYSLDPQTRIALKSEFGGVLKKIAAEQVEARRRIELDSKQAAQNTPQAGVLAKKKTLPAEPLGRQSFDGVEAEGSRTVVTIPAGQIGNDLPINVISEQWYSPDLQLLVMTKHSDPRTGETTYRLASINRAEPDSSLFEVPSDYTVRNAAEEKHRTVEDVRLKLSKPEEQ